MTPLPTPEYYLSASYANPGQILFFAHDNKVDNVNWLIVEPNTKYKQFTELDVWKAARNFQLYIFNLCKLLPTDEKFRLADQMIRSSRSIVANIAERHGRFHYGEQIQFCRQARGSLSETVSHGYTAFDCAYFTELQLKELRQHGALLLKMLNGYILFLKNQKQQNQPN